MPAATPAVYYRQPNMVMHLPAVANDAGRVVASRLTASLDWASAIS